MTTITMVAHDVFAVQHDGKVIAKTSAHALSAVDHTIAEVVASAQQQHGIAVVVSNKGARVPAPRYSWPASRIVQ